MRRREFIAGLASAVVWPLVGRVQQPVRPLVGFVGGISVDASAGYAAAFRKGIGENGYAGTRGSSVWA
jgi:hypothetical protein